MKLENNTQSEAAVSQKEDEISTNSEKAEGDTADCVEHGRQSSTGYSEGQ